MQHEARRPAEPSKDLPADFFRQLLQQPNCQQGLPCNDCGRCEH